MIGRSSAIRGIQSTERTYIEPVSTVFAVDFETAKNTSLWTVSVAVLLALLAVWVVKEVIKKVLTVVILLAIAGLAVTAGRAH